MSYSIVSQILKSRIKNIRHCADNPFETQKKVFDNLISSGLNTDWGKMYGFQNIKNFDDFSRNVPLNKYDDLKPYFERIRSGEQNVLWNSKIKYFSKSSGTTADKSKFIPVSDEALYKCHYKGGKDMLCLYLDNRPDSKLLTGKSLGMGGSLHMENDGILVGDVSAILMKRLPFWAEFHRTPDIKTALLNEWESKIRIIAQKTVKQNVKSIVGVPSWTLVLFKEILKESGKTYMSEIWPDLEVYFNGGVNFEPYRKQYYEIMNSDKVAYIETYNASEGFFGIQDTLDGDGMLLMLDNGIYYEFIPTDQLYKPNPTAIKLEDVELHTNYALVISTNAGLWRYVIGDTVMFTSVSPYRIKVSGRIKSFINIAGEELMVSNADKAFAIACERMGCSINEYTAAPFKNDSSLGHEWIVEFNKSPDSLDEFMNLFDLTLQQVNSDYEAKRYKNMVLAKPEMHFVDNGTFYNWMKSRNKLGGQNKVPRLSSERTYVDALLSFINQ